MTTYIFTGFITKDFIFALFTLNRLLKMKQNFVYKLHIQWSIIGFNNYLAFLNADLPSPDLIRNKVGSPIRIEIEERSIALIVNELTPSSDAANAKNIDLKSK